MQTWNEKLIRRLCKKHLRATWLKGLTAYEIITKNEKKFKNHPAIKNFQNSPMTLWLILWRIRAEMLRRGEKPEPLPAAPVGKEFWNGIVPWKTLDEQMKILKVSGCKCSK